MAKSEAKRGFMGFCVNCVKRTSGVRNLLIYHSHGAVISLGLCEKCIPENADATELVILCQDLLHEKQAEIDIALFGVRK